MKKLVLFIIIILIACVLIGCETDMNTSQETISLTISYKHNFIMKSEEKSYTSSGKEYSYTVFECIYCGENYDTRSEMSNPDAKGSSAVRAALNSQWQSHWYPTSKQRAESKKCVGHVEPISNGQTSTGEEYVDVKLNMPDMGRTE